MQNASLLVVLDEARKKTLHVLDGLSTKHALWAPPDEPNHMLWHGGHIFCMVERVTTAALTGEMGVPDSLPEGWWEKFGWKSKPQNFSDQDWPAIEQVAAHLYEQHHRLRNFLLNLDPAELETDPKGRPPTRPDKSKLGLIMHAFHDEAFHAGQIWLLKKLLVQHRKKNPTASSAA